MEHERTLFSGYVTYSEHNCTTGLCYASLTWAGPDASASAFGLNEKWRGRRSEAV